VMIMVEMIIIKLMIANHEYNMLIHNDYNIHDCIDNNGDKVSLVLN